MYIYIYCMCVYYTIHSKYTQYTYIVVNKTFILDAINRYYNLTALILNIALVT